MQDITTPAVPALESITFDALTAVSGGCKRPPPPAPVTNVNNVSNVQYVQAPVVMPAVCACRPSEPASVDSSVEIGYGQTATA
jgi:hypothetical protein